MPVLTSVIETLAPGTAASVESVTAPRSVPLMACAWALAHPSGIANESMHHMNTSSPQAGKPIG